MCVELQCVFNASKVACGHCRAAEPPPSRRARAPIQSRKISSGRHPLTTARPPCTGKYLRYPATLAMQVLLSARPLAQWGVDDMELMECLLGWGSMDPSSTRTTMDMPPP